MNQIRKVCVYCGSSPGIDPDFIQAATRFGRMLAEHRVGLVFGGGSSGLMGAIATAVFEHGGEITGIIPEFLKGREGLFTGAQDIVITRDMHERKRIMFEQADAFVALPGGIGTLEELVEQLTWAQLGRHRKPILIANIKGFWNALIGVFEHMKHFGFIHSGGPLDFDVVDHVDDILPALFAAAARVPEEEKVGEPETVKRM